MPSGVEAERQEREKIMLFSVRKIVSFGSLVLGLVQGLGVSDSRAAVVTFQPAVQANGSTGVTFDVPYTFGTHKGRALSWSGSANIDLADNTVMNGKFMVPLDQMTTGNDSRDCHMREALGLDYARSSYPEGGHLCDSKHRLPESGDNAIQYPNIEFELTALKGADGQTLAPVLVPGQTSDMLAVGTWTIHGVTQSSMVAIKVTPATDGSGRVRVKGRFVLSMASFQAEVLSFLGVNIKDQIRVALDVELVPAVSQ